MTKTHIITSLFWLSSIIFTSGFAQNVDLGAIKKNESPIKYIAVGSSLSSGVRDGGIFQAAQQSAFPNLIAQQIGISNFKLPLLSVNGTGTKKAELSKTKVLTITQDQKADYDDINLPKVTEDIDNLAIPYLKVMDLNLKEDALGVWNSSMDKKGYYHLNRYFDGQKISYLTLIDRSIKNLDLFTLEIGFYDFLSYYSNGGYGQKINFLIQDRENYYPENILINSLLKKGAKGAICNVPNLLNFPFFKIYQYQDIVNKVGKGVFIQRFDKHDLRLINSNDIFLPSENLNALLSGQSKKGLLAEDPLLDEEVLGFEEIVGVANYNQTIELFAKSNNLALVDLAGLYNKIIAGNYITEDGLKIDPSYPNGNFFSNDGIHPTAIGQAIIANEFIKAINSTFNARIPIIEIRKIK